MVLMNLQGNSGYANIENRLMDPGRGEEGDGGVNGESSNEAYTPPCVKQDNGNLLCGSGNANWSSVTTERAGKGWRVRGTLKRDAYG